VYKNRPFGAQARAGGVSAATFHAGKGRSWSDCLPAFPVAGPEDGVDDLLIQNRLLQREDAVAAAPRRACKGLDLQPVLLRRRKAEHLGLGMVLVVKRNALVVVQPGVEG